MLLKEIYTKALVDHVADTAKQVIPGFPAKAFRSFIFDDEWELKELKDRMKHIAQAFHHSMSANFKQNCTDLIKITALLSNTDYTYSALAYMFIPHYIETYGIEFPQLAIAAFPKITPYTSCEFAVRPFIIRYPEVMLAAMYGWTKHKNEHVRRLVSEGSRPRLPWAMALPEFIKNPEPVLPILEELKNDPSVYVRKSVANHLNDISKDHPELFLRMAHAWKGVSPETDALVKHAARTLLKQGHPAMMAYYGLGQHEKLQCTAFGIHTPKVSMGSALHFSCTIQYAGNESMLLRLEYALYFLRANGQYYKKVFKISERTIQAGESFILSKQHVIKTITTRRYYKGEQKVSLIINGEPYAEKTFYLEV